MGSFSFSAGGPIPQLYVDYPHWRLVVGLRILSALLASTAITCETLILKWEPIPAGAPWWNLQSMNIGVPLVVCSLSIIWAAASLIKLYITHKPIYPGADIGVDLFISLSLAAFIVFAILELVNPWHTNGANDIRTPAGTFELVAIACLIIMLTVHFAFFVWACRQVHVKRGLERRESCDRCLALQLREKIAFRGSDIESMPSRAYHPPQVDHMRISQTSTSRTAVSPIDQIKTPLTPPTAALTPSFASPIVTETIPVPTPVGARYHELDVEQEHIPYPPSSPRRPQYRFEDSDDDEPAPPIPPPKPRCPDRAHRPPPLKLNVRPSPTPILGDGRGNESRLGAPSRAYSISSYYYDKNES